MGTSFKDDNRYFKIEVDLKNVSQNPRCPHGPTLIFKPSQEGKRPYYACAAYRDKKYCSFYHPVSEPISEARRAVWQEQNSSFLAAAGCLSMSDHRERHKNFALRLASTDSSGQHGVFCQTCGSTAIAANRQQHGRELSNCRTNNHTIVALSPKQLTRPTTCLSARSENKKEAQYFFTPQTKSFLLAALDKFSHVLCLGTPTLFENLPESKRKLLLDFDPRYLPLVSPDEFCWFNMMNFHFFLGDESRDIYHNFLADSSRKNCALAIVLDPPFGGRTEVIGNAIKTVIKDRIDHLAKDDASSTNDCSIFWIFPYFMEKKILECELDLGMSDYKICYTNHKEFRDSKNLEGPGGGRKLGSPVRLFTSLPLRDLKLPSDEGYKFCDKCKFWVSFENRHCDPCNKCTSKDGRTYVHCKRCQRCVKPTYSHCGACGRCHLPATTSCPGSATAPCTQLKDNKAMNKYEHGAVANMNGKRRLPEVHQKLKRAKGNCDQHKSFKASRRKRNQKMKRKIV